MSYRVTADEVKEVVQLEEDSDVLTPFIRTANFLVTKLCVGTYESEQLSLLELWLAAHFYSVARNRRVSEGADGVSAGYRTPGDGLKRLESTFYGQQAIALDTEKCLATASAPSVGVVWLGTEEDEE